MIYLVSNQTKLFDSEVYTNISLEEAIAMMSTWTRIQYDSETTGLDPHIAKLVCIQFGNKEAGVQVVVDMATTSPLPFKDILETKYLVGHNLKFDLQFLYNYGIVPRKVFDTMIVEQLLYLGYPPVHKGGVGFSLAAVAVRYLGFSIDKSIRETFGDRGLDDDTIQYAAMDVVHLEDIADKQLVKCRENKCIVGAKLECDFVPVIAYLEWCGIKLDIDKWTLKMEEDNLRLSKAIGILNNYIEEKSKTVRGLEQFVKINLQGDLFTGFDPEPRCIVNWKSSPQVVKVLKVLGFNTSLKDTKTGKDKNTVVASHIKGQKGINDEFLKLYLEVSGAQKVVSTYGQGYLNAINPKTGRIHTIFRQLGADTGRMACGSNSFNKDLAYLKGLSPGKVKYPQLQNLPADKRTRSAFVSEKGNNMVSCDYSALESRLGADIYNEQSMIDEFLYGSGDIHSLVAKFCFDEVKDVPVKEIAERFPKLRQDAKPIGFSQQFGGSAMAIARSTGWSIERSQEIADAYNNGFKGIANFKKEGARRVKNTGYILLNADTGHKSYWHDWEQWKERNKERDNAFWNRYRVLKEKDFNNPIVSQVRDDYRTSSKYERKALNSPTQATGIIIIKDANIQFFKYIVENNLFGVVLLVNLIHDEIVAEYPEHLEHISKVLEDCMENAASKYCKKLPIPAKAAVGKYWIH